MSSRTLRSAALLLAVLLVACDDGPSRELVAVSAPIVAGDGQEIMAWVPPYAIDACEAAVLEDFGGYGAADGLTRVGLQFWVPLVDGSIEYANHEWYTPTDADVAWWTSWGATNGVEILLTIYNNTGTWDWDLARLAFGSNRANLVNALVSEVDRLGLDGVDIDFEGLGSYAGDRAAFDAFIHELWLQLDARGKVLTVDSFHYIWNAPNQSWWSDWVGEVANIHTMGYDDLYEGGSGYQPYSFQQEAGIEAGYPGNAVLMGVPSWVDTWGVSSGRGTTALAHVQEVHYDLPQPTGIAIWDLQLSAAGWRGAELWAEIAALRGAEATPLRKGPYLIYPGGAQMQVLWQLAGSERCTLEWGTDRTYGGGAVETSEYGDDHQHRYTIGGLTPGARYEYRVRPASGGAHEGSFLAPPSGSDDVKLLAYGDTRTSAADHDAVAAEMVRTYTLDPGYQTLLLHVGDWTASDSEYDWATEYFAASAPNARELQAHLPIAGCRGNHEGAGTAYRKYWPYPYQSPHFWSFDYGPLHVAIVDQFVSYAPGSAQYAWLDSDLAATSAEWKVIVLHEPGWSAGGHANNGDVQAWIQPLCLARGVDIIFAGHNHYYARAEVDGVQHVTTGGGGAPLYSPDPGYPYVVATAAAYHFCELEIQALSLSFTVRDWNGHVLDALALSHEGPGCSGDGECDDGDACNGAETCDVASGACRSGDAPACGPADGCCPDACGGGDDVDCLVCGDGVCEAGEDCVSCSADCPSYPGAACGNGVCEAGNGEDCLACPADCKGKTNGRKTGRFCCGDGDGPGPIGCGDARCSGSGLQCATAPAAAACCGDGVCEGAEGSGACELDCGPAPICGDGGCNGEETACTCAADCGAPPAGEAGLCADGSDDDCDGLADCADPDCEGDPACPLCLPPGAECRDNSDCCGGRCRRDKALRAKVCHP